MRTVLDAEDDLLGTVVEVDGGYRLVAYEPNRDRYALVCLSTGFVMDDWYTRLEMIAKIELVGEAVFPLWSRGRIFKDLEEMIGEQPFTSPEARE